VRNLIDRAAQNQAVRLLSGGNDAEKIRKSSLFQLTADDITLLDEGLTHAREYGTAKKEFEELIGLSSAKKIIHKAIANYKLNKLCLDRGLPREKASLHMVFTGNPGTAKTTVARLFAEMLRDEKVLSTGNFVEVGRADLVGVAVGHTAHHVKSKFRQAMGGVLFIDEAYALFDGHGGGYGDEAINTIVQEMENHRNDVIVIFAGYPEPMKAFLERNPGMRSRIAFQVSFDDYSTDELCEITKLMAGKKGLTVTDAALETLRENYETARKQKGYGNGRYVRKMLEEAEMNLAERITETLDPDTDPDIAIELITTLDACDIPPVQFAEDAKARRIGFAC
ncbi:MAG: AAA family ATPase, partial [bacterium]